MTGFDKVVVGGIFRSNLCLLALSHLKIREWGEERKRDIYLPSSASNFFFSCFSVLNGSCMLVLQQEQEDTRQQEDSWQEEDTRQQKDTR